MPENKIPNIIYSDGATTIGCFETYQNFLDFHVENQYCIQNPRRFEAYKRAGYMLYIIDNGLEEDFLRYAIVMIKRGTGKRTYWGMDDIPMDESGQREFENTLSSAGLTFINGLSNQLKTENRNMNTNKRIIRLTESDLHNIVAKSIRKVLKESLYTEDQIGHAIEIIKNATFETLESLGPRAALISYLIDPDNTGITDKGYKGNHGVFDRSFYNNVIDRPNLENDGNAGYTLIDLANLIECGKI